MRRSVSYALIAVVVVLLGSTAFLFTKYQKANSDFADMKSAEEQARDRYSHTIDAIAEIQDSLNAIPDSNVKMLSSDLQTEQQLSGPNGQQALDKIALLRASIMRNKARILQLESSLSKSGTKVAGLQKMVENLKQSVTEKEQMVAELSTRVAVRDFAAPRSTLEEAGELPLSAIGDLFPGEAHLSEALPMDSRSSLHGKEMKPCVDRFPMPSSPWSSC